MIKDTLLVCCLILVFVLIYRIYVVGQKINNLEEKFIILDNFSQTLFNYISTSNDSNQQKQAEQAKANIITYSNAQNNESNSESDDESDSESSEPEEKAENKNTVESTENFETKEILSDMVSQLKESIIQNNKETFN